MKVSSTYFIILFFMISSGISQNFTSHTIEDSVFSNVLFINTQDFDGDGDIDLLESRIFAWPIWAGGYITWYENDGNQNFTSHTILDSIDVWSFEVADIDGDGDMDILSTTFNENKVYWYENDGNQVFTSKAIKDSVIGEPFEVLDIDGDYDIDILYYSSNHDIGWLENDGNQHFTSHTIIDSIQIGLMDGLDMDGDGDTDVLVSLYPVGDNIVWYENDGNLNFISHTIISNVNIVSIDMLDVDGDNDEDFLSVEFWPYGSNYDGPIYYKLLWYENLGLTSVENNLTPDLPVKFNLFNAFPSPFNPSTTIGFTLPTSELVTLEVYNTIGQKIQTLLNKPIPAGYHQVEFSGQNLSSGIYLYRIEAGEWQDVKKMVLLK